MSLSGATTELVGRERELEAIERALGTVRAGDPTVLVVSGEAGIGKSALLGELRRRAADAGLTVLDGVAAEHERDVPFGLVVDAFDDHVAGVHARRLESLGTEREAELGAVLPAVARHLDAPPSYTAAERFRYYRALRALLDLLARERPVALVLDDVHWADEASLELILHLIRRPAPAPHLLALASRPVEPLPRVLDALRAAGRGEPVELGVLGEDAARALLSDVASEAVRARLVREADGNPLFLRELARVAGGGQGASDGALPPTVMAAVRQEVTALPPASRALLDGAAVAGDPFDPELAARAADLGQDALVPLDRLVAADLVRSTGSARGFRFRHPLVRRAVYDAAPPAWRLAAHERVAEALAERGAPPVARAHHVEQSARSGDDAAVELLARAGAAAADTAPGASAHWYAAALRLLPADAAEPRLGLLAPLALAQASAGRLEEARAAFVEAAGLLPDGAPERTALAIVCSLVENTLGLHAEAAQRLDDELAALGPDVPAEARAALEVQRSGAATFAADLGAMRRHAERARALLATLGDGSDRNGPLASTVAALLATASLWGEDPAAAAPEADLATAAFRAADDAAVAAYPDVTYYTGFMLLMLERLADAEEVLARGLRVAREARYGHMIAPLSTLLGMSLWNRGEFTRGLEVLDAAEETARLLRLDYQLQFALRTRCAIAAYQRDEAEMRRIDVECRRLLTSLGDGLFKRSGFCNLAIHRRFDDPERAIEEVVRWGGEEVERIDASWSNWILLGLVMAALELGRREDAGRWADVLERRARHLRLPIGLTRATAARAELALADGDADRAAALAAEAAAEQLRLESVIDALPSLLCGGRALAAAGRGAEAKTTLRELAELAEARAAWRFRDAAASELRRLGVRLAPAAGSASAPLADGGAPELTEREREVAALVAQGRTNKQVAAALFLSEKTVEHYLSRAYAKLGVRTRGELAATWRETG